MTHADTDGLLDLCSCGAYAGFDSNDDASMCRVRCTECCEQTAFRASKYDAAYEWNLMMRENKHLVTT